MYWVLESMNNHNVNGYNKLQINNLE